MVKKYFVYISSTYDDLKAERLELIRIVSEMGAVPVTMDAFDITKDEDRRLIHRAIECCDYFVNITAYKIGEAVKKSFALELEYAYARRAHIPVLALIISEKARWKDAKKEKDEAAANTLEAFKKRLENHIHDFWINTPDLKQKALVLLSREMHLNPRRGWVPGNEAVEPCVANELCRLIRENEMLRSHIKMEGTDIAARVKEQMKKVLKVLATNRISLSFYYTTGENWENTRSFRYIKLFRLLTPELSTPKTASEISHFLGNILNPNLEKTVRRDFPTPSNTIKKIMSDFLLLKLVKCMDTDVNHTGNDEAWEMTEFGKETFSVYRLRQMNRPKKKASE